MASLGQTDDTSRLLLYFSFAELKKGKDNQLGFFFLFRLVFFQNQHIKQRRELDVFSRLHLAVGRP